MGVVIGAAIFGAAMALVVYTYTVPPRPPRPAPVRDNPSPEELAAKPRWNTYNKRGTQ